jgi:hypothetical protein
MSFAEQQQEGCAHQMHILSREVVQCALGVEQGEQQRFQLGVCCSF